MYSAKNRQAYDSNNLQDVLLIHYAERLTAVFISKGRKRQVKLITEGFLNYTILLFYLNKL